MGNCKLIIFVALFALSSTFAAEEDDPIQCFIEKVSGVGSNLTEQLGTLSHCLNGTQAVQEVYNEIEELQKAVPHLDLRGCFRRESGIRDCLERIQKYATEFRVFLTEVSEVREKIVDLAQGKEARKCIDSSFNAINDYIKDVQTCFNR